jgi:ribosomal protein S18 acetylase RimI-like enzyme
MKQPTSGPTPTFRIASGRHVANVGVVGDDIMTAELKVKSGVNVQASAISTIVLGFAADPMARWVWPDSSEYLGLMPHLVKAFGGRAFERGTAYVTEGVRAAALWLPPGIEPDEAAMGAVMAQALRPEIADDVEHVLRGMAEHHPQEPHWYLPLIAADPNWMGQGLGTLLMRHALWRCDEEGIAAYLESSNPRNISFYERHGFRIIGKIQHGSSPTMTPMLRTVS